ncbi:hypothetical protein HJD18_14150 [Thermoleophilia bacterium SCSIO 60948]|nr:hypothetical protein HJD18_14150 [Thermoleophilia bacterium SCSIO 60948]
MRTGSASGGLAAWAILIVAVLAALTTVAAAAGSDDEGVAMAESTKQSPGSLVKSFGDDGRQLDDLAGGKRDVGYSVAVQPDGKILVGGNTVAPNGTGTMVLVRYDHSGRRDRSFGDNGVAKARRCYAGHGITPLESGKIIVVGGCESELGLARFTKNGKLDRGFGENGSSFAPINGGSIAKDVVVGPDGKITVAGETENAVTGGYSVAMARFLPNGELDTSFSGDGHLFTTYGEDTYARGYGVDLQSDGKAIVVGEVGGSWILSRFTVDGQIDTGFGVNGVEYRGPVSVGVAHAVEVLADDRILAAGTSFDGDGFRMAAVRSLPNGDTDTSFGDRGLAEATIKNREGEEEAWAMDRDSKGRILMAGYTNFGGGPDRVRRFALARLRADGQLDRTFGDGDGTVRIDMRPQLPRHHDDLATAVAAGRNGDALVAGYSDRKPGKPEDIAIARVRGERR